MSESLNDYEADSPPPRRGRRSIITESIVGEVQRRKLAGQTILQISTDMNISRSTIYKILSILGYKTKIVFENSDCTGRSSNSIAAKLSPRALSRQSTSVSIVMSKSPL